MENQATTFSLFKSFSGDQEALIELYKRLQKYFQSKQDITQQSFFNDFYEDYIADDIDYSNLVCLFEDFLKVQSIRNKKQKYLLYHWLYYQAFQVKATLSQEGTMLWMKEMLQKKQQAEKTIDDIAKYFSFNKDESNFFKQNIQNSQVYQQLIKYLAPSTELNPQKVEQKHKELSYIIQKMSTFGQSIEYQLQKHIMVTFESAYAKKSEAGVKASNNLMEIKALFEKMQEQNRMNDKMKGKIDELKMTKDQKARYNILEGIKSELTILDVYLLDYLISQAKKHTEQSDKKALKNIVLFVGPSGSGKTTIILRMLGYKLVQTELQQLSTLQPVDLLPEHDALRTSPETTSTTRYMFTARIPQKSFRPGSTEKLYACDSPGFQDTNGCEVDISNSISIQNFLKNCASVKLAVVISQRKIGDKMEGIREIAKIVSSLVVKYSDIENDVLIVLNKFDSQKEYNRLKPGVEDVLKNLTGAQKSNKQYVSFLNSLSKRLKNKNVVRFDPMNTEIQDFTQEMKEGSITNPREVFRYSLSTNSSNCISNRKTTLIKLIKESLGKDNNLAFYYLNQLILFSKCLNDQTNIEQEIKNLRIHIKKQVFDKFKAFQRRIDGQILSNDSNNNTFKDLNKIKEQIKSFEMFTGFVEGLVTIEKLQKKIKQVKTKMLEDVRKLQFDETAIEQSKKKFISTIKFFGKFEPQLQKSVFEKLGESYGVYKSQLLLLLSSKKYTELRAHTAVLKNILQVMQKGKEAITPDPNNPEKMEIIDKKDLNAIIQAIKSQFMGAAKESTQFISQFNSNQATFEITPEIITKINTSIAMFESLEEEGPILSQIYPKEYKKQIVNNICIFGKELIDQLTKMIDPNNKNIDQSKIQYVRHNKFNTQKLKQIKAVYGEIGCQIDRLWTNFQRFISIQTKKLNQFLSDLKNQKTINRKTLKEFKSKINRIIKFSQGDDDLTESINQLKNDIKKSLGEHIKNLKNKVDKIKITLKLKRTLESAELKKIFEYFREVQAFYFTRQFSQQKYLAVNETNINLGDSNQEGKLLASKSSPKKNDEEEDEDEDEDYNTYEDVNISELIKQMYDLILNKLLNPFNEIKEQSKKAKEKGLKNITANYLQILSDFIQYKSSLFQNEINLNKDLSTKITKFDTQEESFQSNIKKIISDIKEYFDKIHQRIDQTEPQKQIYKFEISKIKEFKKLCTILLTVQKYSYLDEIFLQQGLDSRQYMVKIVEILQKSNQKINEQLANRKQTRIDYVDSLNYLKKQIQELKNFDQLQFQQNQSCKFTIIYEKINQEIKGIQGKQSNAITNLFRDETIILPEIKKMYIHLSNDGLKNEDNLNLIENGLKAYGDKLIKSIQAAKEQCKNDETMSLDCPTANTYINRLEKMFKLYQEVKQFLKIENFNISQHFFVAQIGEFLMEQKLKFTYEMVKDKIQAFDYKTKPRQFQRIYALMKKAQYIVQKVTKDQHYSQLYKAVDQKEGDAQDFVGTKFTERLKYFMDKSLNQVKGVFSNQNNEQEIIQKPNFINMYNNLPPQEKELIDTKIQTVVLEKLTKLENAYEKTEQDKMAIEETLKKIVDKLPKGLRKIYKDKIDDTKQKLRDKQQKEMKIIKKELSSPQKNVFESVIKLQSCKNLNVEKELKNIIGSQLKTLIKQISVIGNNKRMSTKQSFKKYLKYFGYQNSQMLKKTKENQKIKDSFFGEEKTFLNNVISQQRQLIREIEGDMVRCSMQCYHQYNKKCIQLNQLYTLALEDDYEGLCPVQRQLIIQLWEQFIMKIKEKIQKYVAAPQINIIFHPASKLEKMIIQLKFIRSFISNFLDQTKKIQKSNQKRFSFLQKTNNQFEFVQIDSIIIKNIARQVKELLNSAKQTTFYDDEIKILHFAALQTEFEKKLINSLKLLEEYEQFYNQFLLQREQDKYSKKNLITMIQSKWQQNILTAQQEFTDAITYPQQQISQRILTLHNLTQIVTNRRWNIIDKELKSKEHLQNFLESKFNQIKEALNKDLVNVGDIMKQKNIIEERYQEVKRQLLPLYEQIQNKANAQKARLQQSIQQTIDQDAKEKLNLQYQNIQSFKKQQKEKIKTQKYDIYLKQKDINEENLKKYIKSNVTPHLIIMKKIIHAVNWKAKENQSNLTQFLQCINKKSKNINQIIYNDLISSKNNYALIIAAESDIFKSQAAHQFKNRTQKQGIQYILTNCPQIKVNPDLKADVSKFYQIYQEQYNKIIALFKQNPDKEQISIVAKQLRDIKDKNQSRFRRGDNPHPANIIAKVFATWSMSKVDLSDKENISIDFQPHPAQIVAIYLLIGNSDANMKNSLIEVLTGQGKSIVLAGLCIYLALKGYRPYCACYSQYLSSRDEKEFKDLFDLLDISSKIKYGTFNQHCEEIINESSNTLGAKDNAKTFREHMKSVIMNKTVDKATADYFARIFDQRLHKNSKKVLIIDEADVFFNQNFFGRLYCPSISLDDEQTKKLIEYIWKVTKQSRQNDKIDKIQKEDIYQSNQFIQVAQKYPMVEELIKNQVIGMLQAVYNYAHQYIIHQDSIKYRDNDSITDKISYGYKTVFVHCLEYQRKAISQIAYRAALKISLNIAPFSYSQLPTFFQAILGVSGTVSSMSDYKRQMLGEKYGIEDTFEIPSIYGGTQRTKDSFTIVKDEQFYDNIVKHTKAISETNRPIALFFKTIKDVTNFYKTPQFKEFTKNTTILTEQTDHESREAIIKRVGQRGKITILTESFARGTDFKIFDKSINDIGGLHVIQTFISADLSEYLQTRGRTARQGNKGSFQVLINQTQLQKFEIICSNNAQFQQRMKNAWKKKDQVQCEQLRLRVEKAGEKHLQTQNLFKKKTLNQKDIIDFIFSHNKFSEIKKNHVRTLIGIDGTASMGAALKKTFDILQDSFTRTKAVLQKKKVSGSFQNQIGIYRNYDSDFERLFQYSGFESDSQKLKQFLQNIQISGGWGNQAMQVLFQHANSIKKLDQIIIIADARANLQRQTKAKRGKYGQNYWVTNKFPFTNENDQISKLKQKKVKIHTLYINLDSSSSQKKAQLKQYSSHISKWTGGNSQEFKIKESAASQFLTGFLVKNILMTLGGQQKGRELVDSYNADFSAPMRL